MRSIFEPIQVQTDGNGIPARVLWRGRTFVVARVLNRWRYVGKWWLNLNPQRRTYYRLEARPLLPHQQRGAARVLEVFKQDGTWTLSYLCD